jgi:hypothetical protein
MKSLLPLHQTESLLRVRERAFPCHQRYCTFHPVDTMFRLLYQHSSSNYKAQAYFQALPPGTAPETPAAGEYVGRGNIC